MSNKELWQQLQYKDETFYFIVHPGNEETKDVPFVLEQDIHHQFPEALTFMCGRNVLSYMCDASYERLMPLRFAYQPVAITISKTKPSMSPTEKLPESNPIPSRSSRPRQVFSVLSSQQLIRQDSILQSTSVSPEEREKLQQLTALFESFVKAMVDGQKEKADLDVGNFEQCLSELKAPMARSDDLQQKMCEMKQEMSEMKQKMSEMNEMKPKIDIIIQNQELMLEKQDQTLDRLEIIQERTMAILTQTYELHEYPIPRLFIILPKDTSEWSPTSILNHQYQLYFLCECGEHTEVLDGDNTKNPHRIHIAKHEGYDLERPTEFFQKYGRYMLTLLEMIKYGVTFAGFASPTVAAVGAPAAMDMFQKSLDSVSQSSINQSIQYLQSLSSEQDTAKDTSMDSFAGREALEGADLRHLEVFIKNKDQDRALGNLYRTITKEGHVKWVCIDHYRLAYKEQNQQTFLTAVELNGGHFDPHLGRVTVSLGSKTRAAGFFDSLAKARRVDELVVTFDWEGTTSDLEPFGITLKSTAISILRLDFRRFRTSLVNIVQSTNARQKALARCINLPSVKMIDIVLPLELFELANIQPKTLSCPPKLSFEVAPIQKGDEEFSALTFSKKDLKRLAEILKTNSTVTTLNLRYNSIGENGAMALSEALKTNLALLTLDLDDNSIGKNGAMALSEALKTNLTLTTLNLMSNSIGDHGAMAVSDALKSNSALLTLYLSNNSIGDNGAMALSEALKTNSTLITLDLWANSIGESGAAALSGALKTNSALTNLYLYSIDGSGALKMFNALKPNSTLTTLDLDNNSIGDSGAVALSEALKTNSTLTALDLRGNSIGDNGAVALSEALKTNSTLATLELGKNSIGANGAVALSEALKTNSSLTTLELNNNSINDNGVVALSEALKTNSTLTTLNLRNNSIGDNGVVALSEALKSSSTLKTLDLSFNRSIGDNGAVALSDALKMNSTLFTLHLSSNLIRDKGAAALAEALKINSTLTTLSLEDNSITDKGAVALFEAVDINSTLSILNLHNNMIKQYGARAPPGARKFRSTVRVRL